MESRRSFVKKSVATSISFSFAGLIRAHGEESTESTTWSPDETTYSDSTWNPDYSTTWGGDSTTTWNPDETTITTTALPLTVHVWQNSFPSNNNGATDLGAPRTDNQLIVPSSNKIAYINGTPEIPKLFAQVLGADPGTDVEWKMSLISERPERGGLDNRVYPLYENFTKLTESQPWSLEPEFANEFNGGDATIFYTCKQNGTVVAGSVAFKIRGKNPLDTDAKSYAITKSTELGKYPYAWAIIQHESRQNDNGVHVDKVFNQFNSLEGTPELPNWHERDGWGIAQIDRSGHDPAGTTSTNEVYNWKANIDALFVELATAETYANTILNGISRKYSNSAKDHPPTYNING